MKSILLLSLVSLAFSKFFLDNIQADFLEFEEYMHKFTKSYETEQELAHRRQVFLKNLREIREFNARGQSWSLGVNEFSDLTAAEFEDSYLSPVSQDSGSFAETRSAQRSDGNFKLPISIDWRAKGVVTPVINTGSCSCGYAVAASSALEAAWAINGHKLPLLSFQQVIDCSTGNKGCTSGVAYNSFKYIASAGLANTTVYPFAGSSNKCNKTAAAIITAKASSYLNVTSNSASALQSAIVLQPVAVGVSANVSIWQSYAGGIVNSTSCGTSINHYVLAVGYNTAGNVPYYVVKNSWGPAWGKEGFMELAIVDGPGICGIQTSSSYPVV